ncbi:MAG: hypothetical protein AAB404_03040 [Patescibacteria group bacterium]
MAKNIFEELIKETEKILGSAFKIDARMDGCDFCFKNLEKEKIRKAFQKTVRLVMTETRLKNFCFREEEISDLNSLASVFLRLVCSGGNFQSCDGQDYDQKHFLDCVSCQLALIKIAEYFTMQLISEYENIVPSATSLFSLLALNMLVDSKEKQETIQKYFPLFGIKKIDTVKVLIALVKATEEKKENLNPEEFEKVLKELIR